jgi:lipopolysaccharide transport system ATP-binding protein
LNDGIYSVTIQVVTETSTTAYLHPDILVFEVHDSVRVGNWFGKWPGVIRPRLEWLSQDVIQNGNSHEQ